MPSKRSVATSASVLSVSTVLVSAAARARALVSESAEAVDASPVEMTVAPIAIRARTTDHQLMEFASPDSTVSVYLRSGPMCFNTMLCTC
jgi:hypothetical protein